MTITLPKLIATSAVRGTQQWERAESKGIGPISGKVNNLSAPGENVRSR